MEFRVSALDDVHDHSLAVNGWEQVYHQMTPGRFESTLVQASDDDFRFFRESTNRRIAQAGVSPEGFSSIAVPLYGLSTGTFQGQQIDGFPLMLLGPGEEFHLHTPESMHYIGVSLPSERMEQLVSDTVDESAVGKLSQSVLQVPEAAAAALQLQLVPFLDAMQAAADRLSSVESARRFQHEVVSVLLGLVEAATCNSRDLTHATYSDIVRRCERFLHEYTEEPVTVLDLCTMLRCSRRTLQTSFQRVANVTPVEYLRSYRLNAVRRLLRSTNAAELLIGDAAARWGFTHLSYFAREYRDLFGELPSQTPRKS
jgi:AraC-like DNA-binding protein